MHNAPVALAALLDLCGFLYFFIRRPARTPAVSASMAPWTLPPSVSRALVFVAFAGTAGLTAAFWYEKRFGRVPPRLVRGEDGDLRPMTERDLALAAVAVRGEGGGTGEGNGNAELSR